MRRRLKSHFDRSAPDRARSRLRGDFKRCIADGGCLKNRDVGDRDDYPAINVSWRDASAYRCVDIRQDGRCASAAGTDEEWTYAAAERGWRRSAGDRSKRTPRNAGSRDTNRSSAVDAIDPVARPLRQLWSQLARHSTILAVTSGNGTDSCYVRYKS